ncbi:PepSY-associated TM helix [Caulifigura coniformis]|uniref:PepSY-associated TM helix n=1 Tax=Caulifigura coniformis TaxID=2527983 RepID=A0A517S8H0_9PLAN|nr:PepSY-associated TM helix domain-containing protein [Caulifigura coniformis]QDT52426.1 PepSY-associated TM helix [Caulifigura coniformis]
MSERNSTLLEETTTVSTLAVEDSDPDLATVTQPQVIARVDAPAPAPTKKPEGGTLFRVVWRWHFYAGVFVAPWLLTLAITGGLYIFKSEVEFLCRSHLLQVSPGGQSRTSYASQLDAVKAAFPEHRVTSATIRPGDTHSTQFALRKIEPPTQGDPAQARRDFFRNNITAYVNPYNNEVLGTLGRENDSLGPFFRTVLSIHRNLFVGTTGRVITELATSWTIILIVTGMYLWWPKNWTKSAGVWWPRTKKRYTLLRDLHAIFGMYLTPIALTIAVTGMFYSFAVGKVIHDAAHYVMEDPEEPSPAERSTRGSEQNRSAASASQAVARRGEGSPRAEGARSAEQGRAAGERGRGGFNGPPREAELPIKLSLDEMVDIGRREYPDRIITANLGGGFRRGGGDRNPKAIDIGAGNDFNATYGQMVNTTLSVDRDNGTILKKQHLSEGGHFWHGWTYPLHVGSIYGVSTKIVWMIACVMLAAMPITGLWMWWERRPKGKSGLPRRQAVRLPKWLIGLMAGFCVLLPIAGASVLLVMLGEGLVRLYRRLRRPPASAGL